MPSSAEAKVSNWLISVPATNVPPTPRNVATRTLESAAIMEQAAASWSYIAQVMALRASGRSKTTFAMPSATAKCTLPSLTAQTLLGPRAGRFLTSGASYKSFYDHTDAENAEYQPSQDS